MDDPDRSGGYRASRERGSLGRLNLRPATRLARWSTRQLLLVRIARALRRALPHGERELRAIDHAELGVHVAQMNTHRAPFQLEDVRHVLERVSLRDQGRNLRLARCEDKYLPTISTCHFSGNTR